MNYKLALQLKDAGYTDENSTNCYEDPNNRDESFPNPTLEELIMACEDDFYQLTKWNDKWFADCPLMGEPNRGTGDTPEEAVALLWIKLNS